MKKTVLKVHNISKIFSVHVLDEQNFPSNF